MVILGKSWLSSQYLWVAIPTVTTATNQQCTDTKCNKRIETGSNYCRHCGTKQKYDEEEMLFNLLSDGPEPAEFTKAYVAMHSLIRGYHGPPLPAERVFIIEQHDRKKEYFHLYGYCKQPFPDIKLKNFEVRMSGIVYCHPIIGGMETDLHSGEKRDIGICVDAHDAIIPFHEFVDQNERVFELINGLARQNIYHRPIFIDDGTTTDGRPFALLEDWIDVIGASNRTNYQQPVTLVPDIKSITGDYLASKVREYTRIYPGKIMSSSFGDKRKPISVRELISRYYEHPLGKHQLELRSYLLDWLKEKMEERLDSCGYEMRYVDDPDNKGTAKLLTEDIAAIRYLLKNIDRSYIVPEQLQGPVAIRDGCKVLLLDGFHLGWLKDFLLSSLQESESKCDTVIMNRLLEMIPRETSIEARI